MTHEFTEGLCVHCGLPPERAEQDVCPINKYGEPSSRALAAIGLRYVGFELAEKKDSDGVPVRVMYAKYQDPLSPGFCCRMFWPQIEAILDLMAKAKAKCVCEMVKEFSGPMMEDAV